MWKKRKSQINWPPILFARERRRELLMSWLQQKHKKLSRQKESQMNLLLRLSAKEKKRRKSLMKGLLLKHKQKPRELQTKKHSRKLKLKRPPG